MGEAGWYAVMMAVILGGALAFNAVKCNSRWADSYFGLTTGCMVKHDGVYVPEDRVWFDR